MPISALHLRRPRTSHDVPLVFQAFNWAHGVYLAATMGSETTAAAAARPAMRRDPMAMLPFCGYNMADYFGHWLNVGRQHPEPAAHLPRELVPRGRRRQVPVARLRREHARPEVDRRSRARPGYAVESPLGWMPRYEDLRWKGWTSPRERFHELMA